MPEQDNISFYLNNNSLEEHKKLYGETYVYREAKRKLNEQKYKKKKENERNSLVTILIIFGCFMGFIGFKDNLSTISENSQKSCLDKHSQDYQAYLSCTRQENFNR